MPTCDIAAGRLEACKDSIGGIDTVYMINFGTLTTVLGTAANADVVISGVASPSNMYKFTVKGNNNFETTVVSSRENGTTFFQQTLTLELKGLDIAGHLNLKNLMYSRPHVIVHTRNNAYFLMGRLNGADVTAGSISTGMASGDFNGYKLTMVAEEKVPANFINAIDEAALKTALGNITVV